MADGTLLHGLFHRLAGGAVYYFERFEATYLEALTSCRLRITQDGMRPLHTKRADNCLGALLPFAVCRSVESKLVAVGSRNWFCDLISRLKWVS